jgi:mitochondrial import receptor subunit TOM70
MHLENSTKQLTFTQKLSCVIPILYSIPIAQRVISLPHISNKKGYSALKLYDQTIEDASAALTLNPNYSKALRRRAHAYEEKGNHSDALVDWTATCIIEEFKNVDSTNAVQRVLRQIAEDKASILLQDKSRNTLASSSFVTAYLTAFHPLPRPVLPENANEGDLALQKGFELMDNAQFKESADEFEKAVKLECVNLTTALNYFGTFSFIRGDSKDAMEAFNKALEIDPNQSQILVKRASVHMDSGTTPLNPKS